MKIHEQPTQIFDPPLKTEPILQIPAPPAELHFPVPQAGRRWQRPSLPILPILLLTILILGGSVALVAGGWFYQSDRLLPGVEVMGVDIGVRSSDEAAALLNTAWANQTITLVDGLESWTVHPSELGITLDTAVTLETALQQGRRPSTWQSFVQNEGQFIVEPVWQLESAVAQSFLQQQADALYTPPIDATVSIVDGQVQINPPSDGRELDVVATQNWLLNNQGSVVDGRLPLITHTLPATVTDVSALAAHAEQLLTTSVTATAYDPVTDLEVSWVITPAVWGEWLLLDVDENDPSQFTWALDKAKGEQFFQDRMAALGAGRYVVVDEALTAVADAIKNQAGPITLRVYHETGNYVVQPGDTLASIGREVGFPYPWLQEANPLLGEALSAGQNISVPSPDALLPLPVVPNKRIIVSISEQRVRVYENGELKWDWLASTGIASSPTAPGIFQIQAHYETAYAAIWDLYMPNFMSVYQPAPGVDFFNGFHGFPTRDGANLLWTQNLGAPVTYGCILLSNENIALLYDWAEPGVVVEIRP